MYDALYVRPFLNQNISQCYIICTMMYEVACICLTLLQFINTFQPLNAIYTFLWLGPMAGYLAVIINDRAYMRALLIVPQTIGKEMQGYDLYCEEVIRLYKDSYQSDSAKYLVYSLFRYHIIECKSPDCYCLIYGTDNLQHMHAKNMFKAIYVYSDINKRVLKNVTLSMPQLLKIVDSMFKIALEDPSILANPNHYENLSLKYISFIHKYMENSLLSYFFIKKLGKNQKQLSFFFTLLFEVYSDKLKHQIRQMGQSMSNKYENRTDTSSSKYYIETIQQVEEFTQQFTQQIIQVIDCKYRVWDIFYKGANTMDELYQKLKVQVEMILTIRQNLLWQFKSCFLETSEALLTQNAAYLKLHQVFSLFIMNDIVQVKKLESKMLDWRKRDQYKEELFLNNFNYMAGESVIIKAGISLENGKILNRHNTKIAQFFGYAAHEMNQIKTINDVMPQHISQLHNYILAQYLTIGYSPIMTTSRKIFLINKEQFLFPCSICVRNDYTILSDCVFNATLLKQQSNKELIMFDEYGRMMSMTKHLFNIISKNRQSNTTLFTYDQFRQQSLLYLLCPSLAKIFQSNLKYMLEQEQNHDVVGVPISNLMCSLFTSSDIGNLCSLYTLQRNGVGSNTQPKNQAKGTGHNKINLSEDKNEKPASIGSFSNPVPGDDQSVDQSRPSNLLNFDDLKDIKKFVHVNSQAYIKGANVQRFKMRFTLHIFYRNFSNVDNRVLKTIVGNSKAQTKFSCMRYYVIECQEVYKTKLKPTNGQFETIRTTNFDQTTYINSQGNITDPLTYTEALTTLYAPGSGNNTINNLTVTMYGDNQVSQDEIQMSNISENKQKLQINCDEPMISLVDMSYSDQPNHFGSGQIIEDAMIQEITPSPLENIDIQKQTIQHRQEQFERRWEQKALPNDVVRNILAEEVSHLDIISSEDKIEQEPEEDEDPDNPKAPDQVHSYNEDSNDEADDQEHDLFAGVKQIKERNGEGVRNEKRAKFDMDCSSQTSRYTQSGGQSITEIYLNHKMPSKYKQFLVTIFIFLTSLLTSMIAMISICAVGFSEIEYYNHDIETVYLIHSYFNEAVIGGYYGYLNDYGILPPNPYFNSTEVFNFYVDDSIDGMIKKLHKYMPLIEGVSVTLGPLPAPQFITNDRIINLELDLISYFDNQVQLMMQLRQNPLALRSLLLRTSRNLEITMSLNNRIQQDLNSLENELVNNFLLIFYLSCAIVGLQSVSMVMSNINFLEFQEKVLLLVTRINMVEFDREKAKLEYAKDLLKDMHGSQVVTYDFVPNIIYFKYKMNESVDPEHEELQFQKSKKTKKTKYVIKGSQQSKHQSTKGNILATKIYNPKLSIRNSLLQIILVFGLTFIYLLVAIVLAMQMPSQYQSICQVTLDSILGFSQFQTMQVYLQLLTSSHIMGSVVYGQNLTNNDLLGLDREETYKNYTTLREQYSAFMTSEALQLYTNQATNKLTALLFNDLCLPTDLFVPTKLQNQICQSQLGIYYSKGVQGVFGQLDYFLSSYDYLIQKQANAQNVTSFLGKSENWALISLFFGQVQSDIIGIYQIYIYQYIVILEQTKNQLIILTTQLNNSLMYYLIISGCLLMALLFGFFYHNIYILHQNIENVEFLLSFIPNDKLSEATTIQMLKAIQNY